MKKRLFVLLILFTSLSGISQNRYDIVISELMADPTPQVALPNNEWIELKNTSSAAINLLNWRIGDASGQSGPLPNFILQPDSFLIVCTSSAVAAMSAFGTTISVTNFPSLDNDSDQLFLRAANGKIIHAVSYTSAWYQNELKKDGGWSLEMIDTKNPCAGSSNWKASLNVAGGTPGKKNSIDGINNDTSPPQLLRAYTTDNSTIILFFDEPVDSLGGATIGNYTIDGGMTFTNAITLAPLFNLVQLKTTMSMAANTVYQIIASNIKDCKGNIISTANKTKLGIPVDPQPGEWIVNEIMFNPKPNGYDYVEFLNNSNKIFDAAKLSIANRNATGVLSSIRALSTVPWLIFPGDYIVATTDAANLALNYLVSNPANVLPLSLPTLPDDKGYVVALNLQGDAVDEVNYNKDWHFKLIDHQEGVALERIDPAGLSQDAGNWHSAASTAGYGTPTYKNSQYKLLQAINAKIEITPKVFSPDNDGRDDITAIQYSVTDPGYIANIIIFDVAGRPVRNLVRNGTLALTGAWNWDGLDDKGLKLPIGNYIVFTEIFNLQGKKEQFKNVVVLARNLR